MEKRSWLWKRKYSEKSPGETDSSGSISSHSERYSDDQETLKESPNHNTQSPEITSKAAITNGEVHDSIRSLTKKLSAALVNVGAKEDLVKQHAKVAEEAVAGWEMAEKEGAILRQQLEAAVQQNLVLDVRVSHLDGALKECVRQLRQAKEENEQMVNVKLVEKTPVDPNFLLKLKSLEKENSTLKLELLSISEELEIRTIERDLSTQAAETASKHQLESIKKAAKIEAECRRLQALARKSSSSNDHKSVSASSLYVDSLTDSQSDSGERLNAVEIDTCRMNRVEPNECEPSCSDSWASALIAELDQFRKEKGMPKNLISCSVEIDIMDDFLEMERLAALPDIEGKYQPSNIEDALRAELKDMSQRVVELEDKLEKIESEKAKLEKALNASQDCLEASKAKLTETENRLEDLQKELSVLNESKEVLEFQLVGVEVEASTMSAKIDSLKGEVEKEQRLSAEMAFKCQELEAELTRKQQEVQDQQTACSNGELKVKQEDIAVAAGKLAECQKTIASLGRQLQSLATLEDFLIDTANLPGFSGGGSPIPKASGELWKLHSNDTFMPKSDLDPSKLPGEHPSPLVKGGPGESPGSSSSTTSSAVSLNHGVSAKSKNGFGKLFSRSKSGIHLDSHQ